MMLSPPSTPSRALPRIATLVCSDDHPQCSRRQRHSSPSSEYLPCSNQAEPGLQAPSHRLHLHRSEHHSLRLHFCGPQQRLPSLCT